MTDGFDTGHSVNEIAVESDTGICNNGGTVTMTCPFVVGSGLNKALAGHSLIVLNIPAGGSQICVDSASGDAIQLNSCSGSHAAYVIVDSGFQLISVGASNPEYNECIATNGTGSPLCTDNPDFAVAVGTGGGGARDNLEAADQQIVGNCASCVQIWEEGA